MSDKKKIFITYVVNLSRGIDNSFTNAYTSKLNHKLKHKEDTRFLNFTRKDISKLTKSKFMRFIYKAACNEVKDNKINTIPYNQSLVAFVTAFEILLYDIFSYEVNKNKKLKEKFQRENKKIPFETVEKYKSNEIKFSEIVIEANGYNFQNMNSVNKAFEWAFSRSVYSLFHDKKLIEKLSKIIDLRHKIIHEAYNDDSLSWNEISKLHALFFNIGLLIHGKLFFKI